MEATIQGCHIFYRYTKAEKANGSTILLLHGWGCDGSIFSFIEKGLSEQADVLTVDFPGHGQSGEPPVPWGVPEYAGQIAGLLHRRQPCREIIRELVEETEALLKNPPGIQF